MEEVIICVALCLFMNGELDRAHVPKEIDVSSCLKSKRIAMRTIEERIQFKSRVQILRQEFFP